MTIMFDLAVILWGEINFFFFLHSLEWNNFMYRLNTPIESRQITFSNIAVILRTDLKACTKKRCAYGSLCWTSFVLLSNDNLSLHDEKEKKIRMARFFFFFLRSKQNSGVKNPPVTNRAFLSRLSTQEIINSENAMNQSELT